MDVVAHATDEYVDIVSENFDVAAKGHSEPLADSTLIQRTLAPVPWFLFAGAAYIDARKLPETPQNLHKHPALFMMRNEISPAWRLRHSTRKSEVVTLKLTPRLFSDDIAVTEAGGDGRPGYRRAAGIYLPCRSEIRCPAPSIAGVDRRGFPH